MNWNSLLTYRGMTLELVVWSIFIGIVIAILIIVYNKNILGSFVRYLDRIKATDPENAVTLEEAGFSKNFFVKFALSHNKTYRKVIGMTYASASDGSVGNTEKREGKSSEKDRPRLEEMKFYIAPGMWGRADAIYMNDGANIIFALIAIAVFLGLALISFKVIPGFQQMITNLKDYITTQM